MAEYISRHEAIRAAQINYGDYCATRNALCNIPSADVATVRHGEWNWKHRRRGGFRRYTGVDDYGETHTITVDERIEVDDPYCPFCGKLNESVFLNYCPNCGAKMDGGDGR